MKESNVQDQIMKKIPPSRKLMITLDLIYSVRELKRGALRAKFKNESEQEINNRLKEIFRHATT